MQVFVYGTLTDPETAGHVLDTFEYAGAATLVGLHPVEGRYPTLAPGGRTEGRILTTPEMDALDRYEGVDRGLYVRQSVPLTDTDTPETVACYVGDPELLDAPAEWPGDGPFEARVARYVREEGVTVTRAP
jgi:gamma-glutamylcyclotransferase (GGCT)/AIG2-like uncharacterized protein YtfP